MSKKQNLISKPAYPKSNCC